MKLIHLLAFIVSAALLWAVVHMASSQDPKSPRELLEDVQTQLELGTITRQEAIRELDDALLIASEMPRPKLLADLHMERGEIYLDMGGYGKAGDDFELVLDAYRPGDRRAETLLADVDIESGDYESAEIRLRQIIAKRPRDARAWVQFGRLGKLTAEAEVEKCYATISDALVPDEATVACELLLSIAARDPRDPSRVALVLRLRDYFGDEDEEIIRDILNNADSASRAYRQARSATARSLQTKVTPESATLMMELFSMAGRDKEAAHLGSLYVADGLLDVSEEPTLVMLKSYERLGQHKLAGQLIQPWLFRGKAQTISSENFFREACHALYRAGDWPQLASLASVMSMRRFPENTQRLASLYQGIALYHRGELDEGAIIALSRFFAGLDHEIFPKSRALGYYTKALAQRNLEDPAELESLLGVVAYDPDCDAKVHLRLSRLMQATPNHGTQAPLFHLTAAMSKNPALVERLMPEWISLGEREIATSALNMEAVYQRLKEAKNWVQSNSSSPYRLWAFGQRFAEDEEWVGLNATAKAALATHPGFLPALDQRIEAELQLGNVETAVELVLQRADLIGIDEQSAIWLDRLPEAGSTNEHLLRLMRADPGHTGRMTVAKTMVEDRELERAETFLTVGEEVQLNNIEKRLLVEIKMMLKKYGEAALLLNELLESEPDAFDLTNLRALNQVRHEGSPDFEEALASLLAHPEVARRELTLIVDELIMHSKFELALTTLDQIDEHVELRFGGFLMRAALVHMLLGNEEQVELYLERADAFEDTGDPELARIFMCLEQRDWPGLAREAKRLNELETEPSELAAIILAIFREDLETASDLLAEQLHEGRDSFGLRILAGACRDFLGSRGFQQSPLNRKLRLDYVRLLRGSGNHQRDPRQALGVLLAFESPGWMPWARAQIEKLDAQIVGPLWPRFLKTRMLVWEGELNLAIQNLISLHLIRPEFVPAWKLHQVVLARQLGSEDHPDFRAFRLLRASSLEGVRGNQAEGALAAAARALNEEGPERALELSLELVEDFPEWAPGFEALALLQSRLGHHRDAVYSWAAACKHSYPAANLTAIPELFAALDATRRTRQELPMEELVAILEDLANHLPHDPMLALQLAELDIENETVDPAAGVDRAFARLDRFRTRTDKTLNQLRARSARRWIDFIVEIDTRKAEELIESELLRRPGELELWLLQSQVHRARGEIELALESCRLLLKVSRDPRVLRELASLLAFSGAPQSQVLPILNEVARKDPASVNDPEMIMTRVSSVLNGGQPPPESTIKVLRNVWLNRRAPGIDIDHGDLGYLYIKALLLRDQPRDRLKVRKIAERLIEEGQLGWYDRAFFKTILGITIDIESDSTVATSQVE